MFHYIAFVKYTHFIHDYSSCHSLIFFSSVTIFSSSTKTLGLSLAQVNEGRKGASLSFKILCIINACKLFCGACIELQALNSPPLKTEFSVQWNDCTHRAHAHASFLTTLTDWNFPLTGRWHICFYLNSTPAEYWKHMQRQQLFPWMFCSLLHSSQYITCEALYSTYFGGTHHCQIRELHFF